MVLDRSSRLLVSSSNAYLVHHSDPAAAPSARRNRDTVFCQMRRALDLVHYVAKEAVVDAAVRCGLESGGGLLGAEDDGLDVDGFGRDMDGDRSGNNGGSAAFEATVVRSIRQLEESVDIMRASPVSEGYKEQLESSLAGIAERTQDFTDSAYTSHERRQNILLHCDRAKVELSHLLRSLSSSDHNGGRSSDGDMDMSPMETSSAAQQQQQGSEQPMRNLTKALQELSTELQQTAVENAAFLERNCEAGVERLMVLQECALMGDDERLSAQAGRFSSEHLDYAEDVAKLLHQVAANSHCQILTRHAQINLRIYGPQVAVAAHTLCRDPRSKVAKANFDNFYAMWKHLTEDVVQMARAVRQEAEQNKIQQQGPPPPGNMMLNPPVIMKQPPTPGSQNPPFPSIQQGDISSEHQLDVRRTHSSLGKFHTSVPNLSITPARGDEQFPPMIGEEGGGGLDGGGGGVAGGFLDPHQHAMEARRHSTSSLLPGQFPPKSSGMGMMGMMPTSMLGSSGRLRGDFVSPEEVLASFKDVENNEIINRAKKMVVQASDMMAFTRGCSDKVKTTQDLFTLAEYFAEETNLLYKVIRLFSYDVPAGEDKRSLMATADHVPKHCHQMQMLIQSPTVGKAATFTKVDSIIKEARQIVLLVARVAHMCYANANKYNLDFSNVSADGAGRGVGSASSDEAFGGSGGSDS